MKRLALTTFYSVVLSSLLLSACGSAANSDKQPNETAEVHNAEHGQHQTESGDLQEKTASLSVLPSFLDGASATVQTAYKTAATVTDILPYIPCYCGCGESAGHKSNLNCFIAEQNDDGSVVWDDHGTRCGVCIEIAVTTAAMKANGVEAERIRQIIDETYKEGYAKPTLTELPPAS
ncbi:PCYCGC motif-containing (lipo)protein [Paenibacillus sp. FJAT-27812]|uniref:PCYCGC motif-containing (lipo)protein n=1 Tax=Paenibacillus sp. FJAT-27812 TaxID=1684143 RepID=UPI0006A7AAF7|nr:PCYCGC motif-containing (lipo)protein [Paenibacillus sp. FJAT-27812]